MPGLVSGKVLTLITEHSILNSSVGTLCKLQRCLHHLFSRYHPTAELILLKTEDIVMKDIRFTKRCTFDSVFNLKPEHKNWKMLTTMYNSLRPLITKLRSVQHCYNKTMHRLWKKILEQLFPCLKELRVIWQWLLKIERKEEL